MNDCDGIAQYYDTSSATKDELFSSEFKELIIGIENEDLRQSFLRGCRARASELVCEQKWEEWLNGFYDTRSLPDYSELTQDDLMSEALFKRLLSIPDQFERTRAEAQCLSRARELKTVQQYQKCYKAYKMSLATKRGASGGNRTRFIDQPIELICGEWVTDEFTVKKNEINAQSGEFSVKIVSPIPIMPTAILCNAESGIEKVELSFYKENRWQNIVCERATVASSTKIIELANWGIEVNSENAKLLVRYLADCVALNLETLPRYKSVSRLGWLDDGGFMPYDSGYKFDGETENRVLYESVKQCGNYDLWLRKTHEWRKSKHLRLQMGASFASPLIKLCDGLPFVLHFWGGTGNGKTVSMMVAMSIWGDPRMGRLSRSLNMTQNSMMATAAFLCHLPVGGDELQTIKSHWQNYDQLIMRMTEGAERGRCFKNGVLQTSRSWQCSFLFTGEEPCTKSESGGGAKNRVIEVESTEKIFENGREAVAFINENYGHAGLVYLQALRKEQNITDRYTEIFNEIIRTCDTTEKQAMSMAFILLGDKLACKYLYPEEQPLTVAEVKEFMTTKKEVDVSERAFEYIVNAIAINGNKFDPDNKGEVWGEIKNGVVRINKLALTKLLREQGFDFDAVKRKWVENRYIIKVGSHYYEHNTTFNSQKVDFVNLHLGDKLRFEQLEAPGKDEQEELPF